MSKVNRAVIDTDFFISYLRGDELTKHSEALYAKMERGEIVAEVSSEVFDDIVSAYRSKGYSLSKVVEILEGLQTIPLKVVEVTASVAKEALTLYAKYRGDRRLHYFDAYHVAAAKSRPHHTLITSDRFILKMSEELGINAIDLRTY